MLDTTHVNRMLAISLALPLAGGGCLLQEHGGEEDIASSAGMLLGGGEEGLASCGNGVVEAGELCFEDAWTAADNKVGYSLNGASDIEVGFLNTGSNLDFVTTGRGCDGCSNNSWRLKLGNGAAAFTFTIQRTHPDDDESIGDIEIIDANGDGRGDIMTDEGDDGDVRIRWGSATSLYDTWFILPVGDGIRQLGAADVEGNGRDAIIAVRRQGGEDFMTVRQRNAENNNWNAAYSRSLTDLAGGIHAFDCDNDGDQDVAVTTASRLHVFRANAAGTLNEVASIAIDGAGNQDKLITSGDFDEDGIPDLMYVSGGELVRRMGVGGCLYGGPAAPGLTTMRVLSGDYDDDGHTDIIYWSTGNGALNLRFLRGHGNGNFHPPVLYDLDVNLPALTYFDLEVGDFDNDGAVDVITGANGLGFNVLRSDP